VGTVTRQHHPNRLEKNHRIKEQGVVFHVVEIVLQFVDGIINRRTILVANLGPTRDPGFTQCRTA
jgi:hypothetical protein